MKIVKLTIALLFISKSLTSQTVTNGNFTSTTTGWSCSPETNPESTYGGTGSNRVAEVDAAAGLCQTISGFTIGSSYIITFDCSRRTSCGPATQTLDFSIDGGALPAQHISRTGVFNFTQESFNFTATAVNHTIDFNGTTAGTCGLIIDNIEISFGGTLPIELLYFNANTINNGTVQLSWQTASELNNNYYSIERSANGVEWNEIQTIEGAGNSIELLTYSTLDKNPYLGISYYRLKQTDFNGQYTYSEINSVKLNAKRASQINIYPNPTFGTINIVESENEDLGSIYIYNSLGQDVTRNTLQNVSFSVLTIDLSPLENGIYFIKTKTTTNKIFKQ